MVTKWIKQLAVPSALAISACGLQAYAQEAQVEERVDVVIENEAALPANVIRLIGDAIQARTETVVEEAVQPGAEEASESSFWLGLACEPLSDVLKSQLNIEKGLWVRDVIADGPAAKAEVRSFDVLLKLNEEDLVDVNQLVGKVEQNGEKEITLKILRGGKEQVLKVVPAARPKTLTLKTRFVPANTDQWQNVEAELKKLREKHQELELMIVRPGIAFPANRVKPVEFPKDTTIKINKHGDKPAEITIKIGDKSWTTTEDKLDELPPEVRVLVDKMRGGATVRWQTAPGKDDQGRALFYGPTTAGSINMRTIPLPPDGVPQTVAAVPPQVMLGPSTTARVVIDPQGGASTEAQIDSVNRKLDAILEHLKKADDVAKLQAEVERLHKEVEALRSQKN